MISAVVPYITQGSPFHLQNPASMAMDKPAPVSRSPPTAWINQRLLRTFLSDGGISGMLDQVQDLSIRGIPVSPQAEVK